MVFRLAADQGIDVREENITRDELYIADEVFFTGTAAEITPIRQIDDRTIGSGAAGEITRQLQTAYFDVVKGKNPKYTEFLDFI
jgi:branched-chain amino acid aminotransferase